MMTTATMQRHRSPGGQPPHAADTRATSTYTGTWATCEELDQDHQAALVVVKEDGMEEAGQSGGKRVGIKTRVTFVDDGHQRHSAHSSPSPQERERRRAEESRRGIEAIPESNEQDQDCLDEPRTNERRWVIEDEQEDGDVYDGDEDETEEDDEVEDEVEDEEGGELVDHEEEAAERAEEVAEELEPFDTAAGDLLDLLDELWAEEKWDDPSPSSHRRTVERSRCHRLRVSLASAVRVLKMKVRGMMEPLARFCPDQAEDVREALCSLSNAAVHLLNGMQAGTDAYMRRKREEVRNLMASTRPLLVDLLLEACFVAEANHGRIQQAMLLKEAVILGTTTSKMLQKAWEEKLDISLLSRNVKLIASLSLDASGPRMQEAMANRMKRHCVRLVKASDNLVRGVRLGVEVDDHFDRVVRALASWTACVGQAQQVLRFWSADHQ